MLLIKLKVTFLIFFVTSFAAARHIFFFRHQSKEKLAGHSFIYVCMYVCICIYYVSLFPIIKGKPYTKNFADNFDIRLELLFKHFCN